uniref:DUF19 domain-containing protein n=1 Tax=Caenorhabditis tropicalis TaxID=1561998 RepID=A0A1I7UWA7_9PELO
MENTKCYKDYVLFETLDRCSHDAFSIGPMSFCIRKMKEAVQLSKCAKEYLETESPKKWSCSSIESLGNCLLPEVQRYCDPSILPIFKEHQSTRLYYLGCDGRLKFKDYEEGINATSASLLL